MGISQWWLQFNMTPASCIQSWLRWTKYTHTGN